MKIAIGLILTTIFLLLAGIHFYWGLGGKWGAHAAIPTREDGSRLMNPKRQECFVVGSGLCGFALFLLVRSGLVPLMLPAWLAAYGLWILAVLFLLRAIGEFRYIGFFKKITTTHFARLDTRYYSPLCLLIGLLALGLQLCDR